MINRIHHVQVTIPKDSEDEARKFYCGVLKFREIAKPDTLVGRGGLWVQVGEQQLHIGTEDGVDRTVTKAHVAYEVEDLEAVERLLSENRVECIKALNK